MYLPLTLTTSTHIVWLTAIYNSSLRGLLASIGSAHTWSTGKTFIHKIQVNIHVCIFTHTDIYLKAKIFIKLKTNKTRCMTSKPLSY